jgi:hypothetical protein
LAGLVYAAALDPGTLLLSEDSAFLRHHQFAPEQRFGRIFFPSKLLRDSVRGSHLAGGFAGLAALALLLAAIRRLMAAVVVRRAAVVPAAAAVLERSKDQRCRLRHSCTRHRKRDCRRCDGQE